MRLYGCAFLDGRPAAKTAARAASFTDRPALTCKRGKSLGLRAKAKAGMRPGEAGLRLGRGRAAAVRRTRPALAGGGMPRGVRLVQGEGRRRARPARDAISLLSVAGRVGWSVLVRPVALDMAAGAAFHAGIGVERSFGPLAEPVMGRCAALGARLGRVFLCKIPAFWFDAAAISLGHVGLPFIHHPAGPLGSAALPRAARRPGGRAERGFVGFVLALSPLSAGRRSGSLSAPARGGYPKAPISSAADLRLVLPVAESGAS